MKVSTQGAFYDRSFKKKYARVHLNDAQMQAINPQVRAFDALNDAVQ
jgi:hypothetical protein